MVGSLGVPRWLYGDYKWPYRTPVKAGDCRSIPVECPMPVEYGSLVELGLAFSLYAGPLLTHR